jgi:hypothetical protein
VRAMRLVLGVAAALVVATTLACSTATPTDTPGVDRLGKTMLRYSGPEIEVTLSYNFANTHPGDDWLFLDTAVTGTNREAVEIQREKIALRIPSGDVIPLASQKDFGAAYPKLAPVLARADIASEPLDTYANRRPKGLDFLVVPGTAIAFESVWVNDQDVAIGRLYFEVPNGVQPGPYELRIDVKETKVRIPFRVGSES